MSQGVQNKEKFFIIGIGASAGGVQALESFFGSLPDNPNGAFVVVQHLSPNHRSIMTEILERQTTLPVREVRDQMSIEPANVYVLPPGKAIFLEDGRLQLEERSDSPRYPIDRFFQSVIDSWGERTIAILLSGTGNDGTEGLQAVSRGGGVALVQSPETAQFTSMPSSAIPSGLVDELLSPQDLAQTVYELIRFSDNFPASKVNDANLIDPDLLQQILDILAEGEEINFSHYKVSTLSRRIHHRCALTRHENIRAYIDFLEGSEEEQKLLRQDLLIGATCFFRDREAWEFLKAEVLPQQIRELAPDQQLRIWVSACATGEEAYSMAIIVDEAIRELDKPVQVKIFATDLDANALESAARGVYPESIASDVSPERLEYYFDQRDDHYQVKRSLREMLIISPHDLTKNVGFSKMNLVSCRNVLIYMQPQLQQQVLRLLHFALAPGGTLFLGSSETLGDLSEEFMALNPKWKIFQKRWETRISIMPMAQQPVVTSRSPSVGKKTEQRFYRQIGEVFKVSLADRQMTCLLIGSDNKLRRVFYNSADLLDYPLGEIKSDVGEIVDPGLTLPLSTALHRHRRDKEPVLFTGIKLRRRQKELSITMRVGRDESSAAEDGIIVVFEVETQPNFSASALGFNVDEEAVQQIGELEYELQQTRENLQVTIEELETSNEEQQATNEELLASNEELQSINEELQSVNEELYTVNAEYQSKIQELTQLNNDIDNLLRSTDIGVIFLDADLNIRKFTPAATRAVNIKSTDVGRPLTDLTNSLNCPNLVEILQRVNQTQDPAEKEVDIDGSDEYVLMRVHPYIQEGKTSDGVVITFVNIDELKQVQEDLYQANEILERLYDISPVGLCLQDKDLKFLKINQTLAKIHGASVPEHLGKTLGEIAPDLATQVEPLLRQVIETGEPLYDVEIRGRTPATPDRERYWSASYYPVDFLRDGRGVGAVVVEITERVQAEQAVRHSEAKLLEAQRLAKIGNWELEHRQDLDWAAARAEWSVGLYNVYGLEPQQQAPSFAELLQYHPQGDRERLENSLDLLITQGIPFSIDVQFVSSDGEPRYLNAIGQAIRDESGEITKFYGTLMDITERKRIERELLSQNQALEEAIAVAQAADSANQAKSEFLANMSHEIRTPINSILLSGQLLQRAISNPKQGEILEVLTSSSQRLLAMINDILELSKLEARKLQLESRPFAAGKIFQSLSNLFGPQTEAKGLTLEFEIAPDVPPELIGDDFRIEQVLSNLIGNAVKFTNSGGITVAVGCESQPPTDESSVVVRFSVRDTGIGIAASDQEKLFQPFVQADNSTTRQFGGTGLGLAICRRIVETMGGEIGVDSAPGRGSTFWFKIPLEISRLSETPVSSGEGDTRPTTTSSADDLESPIKILLVEDYPDNRNLLSLMLENNGYQADSVSNGQEFLDRIAERDYDIVLMDCQMPVLDGYEATQRLREREGESKHTIIIGLTAHATPEDRQKCLDAGMDDYLSKPIVEEDLIALLRQWTNG